MRFWTQHADEVPAGVVVFSDRDQAFDFQPVERFVVGPDGTCSAAVANLQIEVDVSSGRCLYAWGYVPRKAWKRSRVEIPAAATARGLLFAEIEDPRAGVSYATRTDPATAVFNPDSGWLRVGAMRESGSAYVEFTADAVAELADGTLVAMWLRPSFVT